MSDYNTFVNTKNFIIKFKKVDGFFKVVIVCKVSNFTLRNVFSNLQRSCNWAILSDRTLDVYVSKQDLKRALADAVYAIMSLEEDNYE